MLELLDDLNAMQRLDPSGMGEAIAGLPRHCREAWAAVQDLPLPPDYALAENVVIAGMGGSAIGGALLQGIIAGECPVPIAICRDYDLPAFVDERTLVIASSYSGNTEETLSAARQARERGARILVLASGGELLRLAKEWGAPAYTIPFKGQPRAALGYSLIPLLGIAQRLGWVADKSADVADAAAVVERWGAELAPHVPAERNAAKQTAARLHGRIPFTYGAEHLAQVAARWQGQFNENAKNFAGHAILPELNHNTVEGFGHPDGVGAPLTVFILRSDLYHPRNRLRCDITGEVLDKNGIAWEAVRPRGQTRLAEVLSLIHFGDWVSYYLALLNGEDPTQIANIGHIKRRLAG
ncbi:MAG: bifunctional phosphoglucose/phosphomannose isomerase [Anaerolineae bacterium]|nr:bifunctional phosphoglucose/phosphomannose isomerase [Anaerolineae bacterium]